jgi:hypothetical protein
MKNIKSWRKFDHPCRMSVAAINAAIDANLSMVGL